MKTARQRRNITPDSPWTIGSLLSLVPCFLVLSCAPGDGPASPGLRERYEYTLAITAQHPDSLIVSVTASGAKPLRRFVLPYHYGDNPLDSIEGSLVKELSVQDSSGALVGWSIDSQRVGPLISAILQVPEHVSAPFRVRFQVDLGAIARDSGRPFVPRVFYDGERGFLTGTYLFPLPYVENDLARLWRSSLDIGLNIQTPAGMPLAGVASLGAYRTTYELLFVQVLLGLNPIAGRSGGIQPFSIYDLTSVDLTSEHLLRTEDALASLFADIVPGFGSLGVNDYAVTFMDFGGGALEGTHGFITDAFPPGPDGDLAMVLAHEILHHFIGIRCGEYDDPWWKESVTTYLGWTLAARLGLAAKSNARSWLAQPFHPSEEEAGYTLSSPALRDNLYPRRMNGLVYSRGAQVAMLMDRAVRLNTGNAVDLEEVTIGLVKDFDGRAFHRADLVNWFHAVGRTNILPLLRTYVDSTALVDSLDLVLAFDFLDNAGAFGR